MKTSQISLILVLACIGTLFWYINNQSKVNTIHLNKINDNIQQIDSIRKDLNRSILVLDLLRVDNYLRLGLLERDADDRRSNQLGIETVPEIMERCGIVN